LQNSHRSVFLQLLLQTLPISRRELHPTSVAVCSPTITYLRKTPPTQMLALPSTSPSPVSIAAPPSGNTKGGDHCIRAVQFIGHTLLPVFAAALSGTQRLMLVPSS